MDRRALASIAALALVSLTPWAEPASAEDTGDLNLGLKYARSVCAECHAVEADDEASAHVAAPTFAAIANTRGMTRTALVVWMQSPHPSMPQLIVPIEDRDNVIAYILSLKEK